MSRLRVGEQLKANYDEYYRNGESEWRQLGAVDKAASILRLCGTLPKQSVIEIGAGEGAILQRLSELGFGGKLYAIEVSRSGVEAIARRRIPRLVDCRQFDGYEVPYANDSFDLAIVSHVIEHVEHPRQLLHEASRVARHVFVEVPLEDTSRRSWDFAWDSVGHINFYSPRTFRWLIQSCHLHVLRQITTNPSKETYAYQLGPRGVFHYYIKQLLLRVAPHFATKHFCYHGALVCQRAHQ